MLNDKLLRDINAYIGEFFAREVDTEYQLRHSFIQEEETEFCLAMGLSDEVDIDVLLKHIDAGFSETLLKLIDHSGKTDAEIYKRALVDRKLFSKIRNNADYKPSKHTAIAFALALELDLAAANDLIGRAGYTLTHSNKFDLVVEYFIIHQKFDIFELNEVLYRFDLPMIGV